jgi:hypothetical protein
VYFEKESRLKKIQTSAFLGSGLQSITFPESCVALEPQCLMLCDSLEKIVTNNWEMRDSFEHEDQNYISRHQDSKIELWALVEGSETEYERVEFKGEIAIYRGGRRF